jgi:hypothetical protein
MAMQLFPCHLLKANWTEHFDVVSYQDFPDKIWNQARLVVKRKSKAKIFSEQPVSGGL